MEFRLVSIRDLIPTEAIDPTFAQNLMRTILGDGVWTHPIIVHADLLFIMDGHHRLEAARQLNLSKIPAMLCTYCEIRVEAWRQGETITPDDVVAAARSGRIFPFKTTRHLLNQPHAKCCITLETLR